MNLLLRILHFKPEPANDTSHGAPQLSPRKVLPDTRPLAMQEGNLRKVGRCAPGLIGGLLAGGRIRIDPPLREELVACVAPELGAAVDGVRADEQTGTTGDWLAGDGGVADGLAEGHGDGGIQAQDFLADAV